MYKKLLPLSIVFLLVLSSCSVIRGAKAIDNLASKDSEEIQIPPMEITFTDLPEELPQEVIDIVPEAQEALVEELIPVTPEEAVEANFEAPEAVPEPEPMPEEVAAAIPEEAKKPNSHELPAPSSNVTIAGTVLPAWFVYISSFLILACLLSICYISKQHKESYWRRNRD